MVRFYTERVEGTDTSIVRAVGALTIAGGDVGLRDTIANLLTTPRRDIVLDLRDVTTIDSSGIGELVGSYTTVNNRGGRLKLSRLPSKLDELLRVTQLITIFDVHNSPSAAVDSMRPEGQPSPSADVVLDSLSFRADISREGLILPRLVDSTQVLAEHLLREPTSLYELSPRRFEELIAELVGQFGWRVQLTPISHDGGRDILAFIPTDIGDLLCLIEAKRYREDRKVGVGLVRQLWGTVNHDDASLGLLVTSSGFSREAREFQQAHQSRLRLKDNADIFDWLRMYRHGGWRRQLGE